MSSRPHLPSTEAETERRRRAGLCFYCGKTGHGFRSCPSRLEQLARTVEHRRVLELKEHGGGYGEESKKRSRTVTDARREKAPMLPDLSDSIHEPMVKCVRSDAMDSSSQRYDSVVDENDLLHHHNLLQHESNHSPVASTFVIRKKPLRKRQLLAQYLPGFSYPGGPGRLVYGTKVALRELRLAVTRDGLVLDQQPLGHDTSNNLVAALETSTKHLVANAEFPTNFLARVQNLHINEDTTTLSLLESDRAMLFDVRQVMAVLKAAGRCMVTVGYFEMFVYRLGIVTCSGSGSSTRRRVQVIEEQTTECLPTVHKRTIWLYMRVDEYGDEVKIFWFGFRHVAGGALIVIKGL
ncbi:hypothetical protein LTR86_008825 [Recurvomyces mirabilis]|nr:hypothetical protein LTR86_008825 [Recurvomyces mirabilis]